MNAYYNEVLDEANGFYTFFVHLYTSKIHNQSVFLDNFSNTKIRFNVKMKSNHATHFVLEKLSKNTD